MRVPILSTVFAVLFATAVPSIILAQQAAPNAVIPDSPQATGPVSTEVSAGGPCTDKAANPTSYGEENQETETKDDAKPAPECPHPPVQSRLLTVGAPKIYDDLYLKGLLSSLQNQLTNVHSIDQATFLSHIGVAQGATLNQISTAISGSGMPTPTVSTFSLAPGVPAFSYPPGYTGVSSSGATPPTVFPTGTATATTPGTQTAFSSVAPSAPAPSAPSLTTPSISSLGQSSLDTYNESLQLSAEISNTALLLQGALSDAYTRYGSPKTTVTVGFPITIQPPSIGDKELAGAVAEIHVTICSLSNAEDPSIATLLPQARTYNVASLVEKNFLGSACAILGGVINVGGGFFWSHKRYYLVQQQETVAFLAPASTQCGKEYRSTAFTWQIHPVLGNEFVRPGNSVNFVQVAVPKLGDLGKPTEPVGKACVEVLWRKPAVTGIFQRRSDEYLDSSQFEPQTQCYPIDYYNSLTARNHTLMVTDAGQGNVTIKALGTFVPGTVLRLGNSYVPPVNSPSTHDGLTFSVPAASIAAADEAYFVGRDGGEMAATRPEIPQTTWVRNFRVEPYSNSQSMVTVPLETRSDSAGAAINPWVVVLEGKIFDLNDGPFFSQTDSQIQVIVPNSLVASKVPAVRLEKHHLPVSMRDVKIEPYSDSQSILTVQFINPDKPVPGDKGPVTNNPAIDPWVVVIGGKVFGLSDAPFFSQTDDRIQVIVPTSLIQSAPRVELERLLWQRAFYSASATIPPDTFSKALSSVSATSILSSQNGLTIGLVGSGLAQIRMAYPAQDLCTSCTLSNEGPTFLTIALLKPADPKKDDKSDKKKTVSFDPTSIKQLVLCRYDNIDHNKCDGAFPPILVSVPKLDSPAAKPSLDTPDPVPVNTAQISITGAMLDQVVSIEHAKLSLPFRLIPGKKPSLTIDLPTAIASVPGGYGLLITFADKSTAGCLLTIKKTGS